MKKIFLFTACCLACTDSWAQSGIPFLTNRDNFCTSSGTFQGNWQLIGPKSFANQNMGRIDPVWVDPADTSHILAGSLSGGLFEKIPGTMTWRPLTDKLPGIGVHDIAVHKGGSNWNEATLVISTQTGVNDPERCYGLGIYYSTDGGQHWTFDEQFYVAAGKGTPVVPRTRFMHGTDGLISIVNHKILRKTSFIDPQSQWEDITPVGLPANSDLFDLEMSPTDANVFWVAGSNEPGGTTGAVLLYTLDGGDNFTNITSTCPDATFFNVALPANNHAFVYYYNATTAKVNHYVQSGGDYELQPNPTTPAKQGIWFEVSRIDLDEMYFGTSATNAFSRWNNSTSTLGSSISTLHADVRYILASDSGDVYVGDDGGVSRSNANGAAGSWQNLNGEGLAVS